jgi:hypothetical protein
MARKFLIDSYIRNQDGSENPFSSYSLLAENTKEAVEAYFTQYPSRFLTEGFGIRAIEQVDVKVFIKRAKQADKAQKVAEKEKEIAKLQKELEELRKPDNNT